MNLVARIVILLVALCDAVPLDQLINVDVFSIVNSGASRSLSRDLEPVFDNVVSNSCETDKTHSYEYSTATNIFSSAPDRTDSGLETMSHCIVHITCLGQNENKEAIFDLQVRDFRSFATRHGDRKTRDSKFSKIFRFTRSSDGIVPAVQYDPSTEEEIANMKKGIVESFQLHFKFGNRKQAIQKAKISGSLGVQDVSYAAVSDRSSGMYILEERFTGNDIVEYSPATTARSQDFTLESITRSVYAKANGIVHQSVDKTVVKFLNVQDKEWDIQGVVDGSKSSSDITATTTADLKWMRVTQKIDGVVGLSSVEGFRLKTDNLFAKNGQRVQRRPIPTYAKSADLTNDHLVRHLLPRAKELEPSQVAELVKEAEDMNDAERAGILFMILAASGQEAAHLHLIEIASSPSQKLSDSAKASLIFSSGVSERTARLAATKLASVDHLPIISSLLATQSPELVGELTKPYMAQLKSTRNPAQLVQAINGLSNLKDNLVSVAEDILPYVTYSESDTVRASAIKTLGPMNCRSAAVQSAFASTITNGSDQLAKTTLTELARSLESCPPSLRSPILDKAVMGRAWSSRNPALIQDSQRYLGGNLTRRANLANTSVSPGDDVWVRDGEMYNVIESKDERLKDIAKYPYHNSFLWGRVMGTGDINGRIMAGSFAGVDHPKCDGDEVKIMAHVIADVNAFNFRPRLLDINAVAEVTRETSNPSLSSSINVVLGGQSVLSKGLAVTCQDSEVSLKTMVFPVGKSNYSFPFRGMMFDLEGMVVIISKHQGQVEASINLATDTTVHFSGSVSVSILFGEGQVPGGLVIESDLNFKTGPQLNIGGANCTTCTSMVHGNGRSFVRFSAFVNDRKFNLEETIVEKATYTTDCIGNLVLINGQDPALQKDKSPLGYGILGVLFVIILFI